MWFYLFFKRNFRHPAFLILLVIIPLLALSLKLVSSRDSTLFKIGYAADSAPDETLLSLFDSFEDSSVLKLTPVENTPDALKEGKLDAMWVFKGGFEESLRDFIKTGEPAVKVYTREENEATELISEKLFCFVYPYLAPLVFEDYASEIKSLTESEVKDYYSYKKLSDDIVRVVAIDKSERESEEVKSVSLSAMRGILALFVVLASLASALFTLDDERRGLFALTTGKRRLALYIYSIFSGILPTGAVYLLSIRLIGLWESFFAEASAFGVLALTSLAFSLFLASLFSDIGLFAAVIPTAALSSLLTSPIFLNISSFPVIQALFPTYYYLYSFTDLSLYPKALCYSAVLMILSFILVVVKGKKMLTNRE